MSNTIDENLKYSEVFRKTLGIQTEPIAVKFIEDEAQIPENAVFPLRDLGAHLAMCQAFALVRREKKTILCDKKSEWCWCPLVAFGLCESAEGTDAFEILSSVGGLSDREAGRRWFAAFPRLPFGKYLGVLLAPLCDCAFKPDVTLVYCDNNSQMRGAVLAVKSAQGVILDTQLDAIDSCAYACVPSFLSGSYRVTLPDIGEHERAAAGENEIILSVPSGKLAEITEALSRLDQFGMGYKNWKRSLSFDFPRPPFYEEVFRSWGLS